MDNCFNPTHKCQNLNCKKSVREHVLSFIHNTGRVNITVGWAPFDLEDAALANAGKLMCSLHPDKVPTRGDEHALSGVSGLCVQL